MPPATELAALITAMGVFLGALTAFLRTVVPINSKLNRLIDIVSHEWETNGKTGVRDTITLVLEKLDAIEERLARGDARFTDIEAGQAEAARRGEAIKDAVDALRRDVEGKLS